MCCEIERIPVNDKFAELQKELASLREKKNQLEDKCSRMLDKQYKDNYEIENLRKQGEYFAKAAEKFEKENKALREVVKLWA
jgi:septal ring factor EnvC (AmiA/AmiB activator)